MDQAVSIFGQEGNACFISVAPLAVRPVKLRAAIFVVAHCTEQDENCDSHRSSRSGGPPS
jgi:galactokinase